MPKKEVVPIKRDYQPAELAVSTGMNPTEGRSTLAPLSHSLGYFDFTRSHSSSAWTIPHRVIHHGRLDKDDAPLSICCNAVTACEFEQCCTLLKGPR